MKGFTSSWQFRQLLELDGEISSQISSRSLVGGSWVEGPPFSVQGYVMSLFFLGNVP